MKIRTKISLVYTLLSALVLIILSIFIYVFTAKYKIDEFYGLLSERALLTAQAHLQQDELNSQIYTEIRTKYLRSLPTEEHYIYYADKENQEVWSDSVEVKLPKSKSSEVFLRGYTQFKERSLFHYAMFYHDNDGDFIIYITAEDLYGTTKLITLKKILIVGGMLSLVLIYFLGRIYAHEVLKPISSITRKVKNFEASNLHLRLDSVKSKDELKDLVDTFNKMLDRLETAFEIQNNFLSHASHELKNPLTAILGEAEISLSKDRNSAEYAESIKRISKEANRLELLTENLFKLAQASFEGQGLIPQHFRIDELIINLKKESLKIWPERNVLFEIKTDEQLNLDDPLKCYGFESMLQIALANLIDNSCKFSESTQPVVVKVMPALENIKISVSDKGVGIPEKELKSIFEPFFRATNVRSIKGFGIGLPLTKKIVDLHHGFIDVVSERDKGTTVTVSIARNPDGERN
ncbi:MAG: ATP-binding protein [Cyclobacteriaceae bacterium]